MNREDYLSIEQKDGVATIWLDQQNEKVNKVSPEVIGLFERLFDELEADTEVKAVVLISKKKDFIAGADIEAFQKVQKPGDWEPVTRKGHAILEKMESGSKPIVAAINGSCLGAGLEIALACTARIASTDRSTKLALPEVQLGLLPGGGGTQRLPRLIGLQKSLDMMLTGKNFFAYPAEKLGLVDRLVEPENLHSEACKLALELTSKPIKRKDKRSFRDKIIESLMKSMVFKKAKEMVMRQTQGNYPAPLRIIECVQIGMTKGMKAGLDAEAKKFEELILTNESRQLINIFFGMNAKKKNPMKDQAKSVKKLGMLGAGFMGAGIAEVSITKNIEVVLKDIKQETIDSALKTIEKNLSKKVQRKALTQAEYDDTMSKVKGDLDYNSFADVDIVVEAVFEDLNLKHKVIAETEAATKDDCIFASNTSALPISKIAEASKRPELVIGMHYFSPVPKMPLLEIITTDKTADWVTATCYDLGVKQGKTVIVVKDGPGFYTTRILAPFMNETLLMLEEGADILQIDKAVKQFGYPVGSVTLFDEVGIDVAAHVMKGEIQEHFVKTREGAVSGGTGIGKLFEAGYHGKKNKKGFYLYDKESGKKVRGQVDENVYQFFRGTERKEFSEEEIQYRCAFGMINEAAYCLQEGILATPLDGDIGAIFGIGFPPFRGGPFRYIDYIGANQAVKILEGLAEKTTARFKPAQILYDYAKSGKKFYKN